MKIIEKRHLYYKINYNREIFIKKDYNIFVKLLSGKCR